MNINVKLLLSEAFFQPQTQLISLSGRAPPRPARGAYSAPQTASWIKDPTSKRRGEEMKRWGGKVGKGEEEICLLLTVLLATLLHTT